MQEKALELADKQDARELDFASDTRNAEIGLRKDRDAFLRKLAWVVLGIVGTIALALLGLVFFGNEDQRVTVKAFASPALIGLAGYGVITTIARVVKAFSNR